MSLPKVRFYSTISFRVRHVVESALRHLQSVSPMPKSLNVVVVPAATVQVDDAIGFGLFGAPNDVPTIVIGGVFSADLRKEMEREDWLHTIPNTIAHEWVHAEQWRDGKKLTERGVDRRAESLLKGTQWEASV